MDEPKGIEGKEHLENQQHNPPSLGEGDKSSNMNGPAISPCANTNDFSNMMNLSTGFNNGMDYNQMLQLMSGNMGAGMANFNPMMGKPKMMLLGQTILILLSRNAEYGYGSDAGDVREHG